MTARGRAPSQRQLRVGEELRHFIAELLAQQELRDPALSGVALTVTEVRMTPDLKAATVFVTPLAGGAPAPMMEGLRRAAPWIRSRIGRNLQLRHTPAVRFELDHAFEHASRIAEFLRAPAVARDIAAPRRSPGGEDEDGKGE